jgi:TRAP-type C4-dicarboxylate transport system substrate-binding protein
MGRLYIDFAVLDTPYLYDIVEHLLKVTDPKSPVMQKLNAGILKESNCRILYSFYFGTRELTCNKIVKSPKDLADVKIRCIPFDIYETTVKGLGAKPVPLDWVSTKAALVDRKIDGQENPANTMVAAKIWENQKYLMQTNHIIPAEFVVMHNEIWKRLSKAQQKAITEAAQETAAYATKLTLEKEASDLETLKKNGMIIVTEKDGLDIQAFKENTKKLVMQDFGKTWSKYYKQIESLK